MRDGDVIVLDAHAGTLDVEVTDSELEQRRSALTVSQEHPPRGYTAMYVDHVLQADRGCDFDFLVGRSQHPEQEPDAIFDGWVGGW